MIAAVKDNNAALPSHPGENAGGTRVRRIEREACGDLAKISGQFADRELWRHKTPK